jgi:hypothetical protein
MRLFVHALDENGDVVTEDYRWDAAEPQQLWQPHWQPGDLIMQIHPLPLDSAVQVRLGLFDPYTCDPGPCQNVLTGTGEAFILLPRDVSGTNDLQRFLAMSNGRCQNMPAERCQLPLFINR